MTTVIKHSLLLSTYHNNTHSLSRTRAHALHKFSFSSITSITNRLKLHIIRCLNSDRRSDRSDRRKVFQLKYHGKLTYFILIFHPETTHSMRLWVITSLYYLLKDSKNTYFASTTLVLVFQYGIYNWCFDIVYIIRCT